jgi:hypothetical protein
VAPAVRNLVDGPAKSRRQIRRNRRLLDGALEGPDSEQPGANVIKLFLSVFYSFFVIS